MLKVHENAEALGVQDLGDWWDEAVEVQGRPRRPEPPHACGDTRLGWAPSTGPVYWCRSCGEVLGPAIY